MISLGYLKQPTKDKIQIVAHNSLASLNFGQVKQWQYFSKEGVYCSN